MEGSFPVEGCVHAGCLHDFWSHMCLQCSMKPGCSAQLSGGVQDTLSLVMLSPFFKLALEIERMHVQELS